MTRIEGGFLVQHRPDRETRRSCCKVKVLISDADRAKATDLDPIGEIAALARCDAHIRKRHGWQ